MRLLTLLILCAASLVSGCAKKTPKPNVLLVVVDTLRADRVGGKGLTPHLDRFAAESVVFDHAQSPRAKTTPAVASLLTGLYPHDHGVRDLTTPLRSEVPTFAEALDSAGYRTGAIVGNYVLKQSLSGLQRGFDMWVEDLPESAGAPPHDVPLRRAASITDGALCALGLGDPAADGAGPKRPLVRGESPWFLWLHYMDPHGLYDPPPAYRPQGQSPPEPVPDAPTEASDSSARQWIADYNVPAEARLPGGGIDARRVRDLYDGEVRYVDAEIGRLLERLQEAGVLDDTVVVFVGDHGESLGEHDYWFEHGRFAYEVTCRVPLWIHFPPSMKETPTPGLRHGDIALADIVPTLSELLRLPRPRGQRSGYSTVRGESRAAMVMGRAGRGGPVFCEKAERVEKTRAVQSKAVRIGDWKLLRRYTHFPVEDPNEAREGIVLAEELYDLALDPLETTNLVRTPPAGAPLDELSQALLEFASADMEFAELARVLQRRREDLGREDPEALRALQALGY